MKRDVEFLVKLGLVALAIWLFWTFLVSKVVDQIGAASADFKAGTQNLADIQQSLSDYWTHIQGGNSASDAKEAGAVGSVIGVAAMGGAIAADAVSPEVFGVSE